MVKSHLLRWWDELDEAGGLGWRRKSASIDFEQLQRLIAELVQGDGGSRHRRPTEVQPIEAVRLPADRRRAGGPARAAGVGAEALAAGEVGVILVAGGSGTRLGFDGPKGTFPIGPVSSASLFQIHAEKIVALGRRIGASIPLYIMTSPENHQATVDFFQANGRFGLEHVRFFVQGQMPAVDRADGQGACSPPRTRSRSRPTATAARWPPWPRPGRAGPRAAWRRCASAACGRSSTSRWIIPWSGSPTRRSSACTARPTPRCRSRSSSGSRPTRSWAWWSASTDVRR